MSMYETLTVSIAIVSAVLSLISIAIVVFDLVFKLGKLRFEQYYHYGFKLASYYFQPKEGQIINFCYKGNSADEVCAAISLKITNNSAYPITIDSIYLSNDPKGKENPNHHDNLFSFDYHTREEIENAIESKVPLEYIDVCEKVILPVTLQPYEIKHISAQFPHFKYYVSRIGDTVFPYMHITTARKTITLQVEVPEYNALMSEPPRVLTQNACKRDS